MMRNSIVLFFILFLVSSCATRYSVCKISDQNIEIDNSVTDENQDLISLLAPYKEKLEADMSRVLAISDTEMEKDKPESNLSNFMADMLLSSGVDYCLKNKMPSPDMAYVNYGGIRATLPRGEIKVQNVFELMPFENTMVFLKLSGAKFKEMAETIARKGGDGVAGIRLGIKNQSVVSLQVGADEFDPNKSYWLVTNDYVAGGGDNMDMFLQPEKRVDSGQTIRDLIIQYMKAKTQKGELISAQKDGRIFYE